MNMLRRLPSAAWFIARGAVVAVAGNLSLAVLSLALALSLWLYVTDKENPKQVETFNSAVPIKFVNVPNGLAVANASATSVRVQVEATKSELRDLRVDDFEATVNLGGFDKGVVNIAVSVTTPRRGVDISDVTPARVDVTLEALRTRDVPAKVSVVGSPQLGFAAGNASTDPQTVTVSGAESLVVLVDAAVAEVNLTGLRVDVDERFDLKPRDSHGGEISRVSVNPTSARVRVDIQQREFSDAFVASPTIRGQPASGYNITNISVDPPIVTVTGSVDVLQSIDAVKGVSTEEIAVADQRSDVVRQVALILPPGARVLNGNATVNVHITITPEKGEFSYSVVPQLRNVAPGLVATFAQPAVTVTLAGDVPTLVGLTPGSITVIADAQNRGPGIYALPLQVQAPPGTTVVRTAPGELGVALGPRP